MILPGKKAQRASDIKGWMRFYLSNQTRYIGSQEGIKIVPRDDQ